MSTPYPETMSRLAADAMAKRTPEDLALGFLRYEVVRKMTPHQFKAAFLRNLQGKGTFDDLIDAEITPESPYQV